MSLPHHYKDAKSYFEDALSFLKTYKWIYSYPNTHILVNKVLNKFPLEWADHMKTLNNEELNSLSLGQLREDAPVSLVIFFNKIQNLKLNLGKRDVFCDHKFPNNSGLSRKKVHEILSLAPIIHEVCQEKNINHIIDVGAGLGYLPQFLFEKYGYFVVGIEGSPDKVKLARTYQEKNVDSKKFVKYIEHFITDQSKETLRLLFEENSINSACVTGLHSCADLSITILDLFAELDFAHALIIMPCCYHRLKVESRDNEKQNFNHFPASKLLKQLFEKFEADTYLKTPFLRLACQNTVGAFSKMTVLQHNQCTRNCLYRAILQKCAETETYEVTRLKRKSGKVDPASRSDSVDHFEVYLANLKYTHALIGAEIDDPIFFERMREKWNEHKEDCYLVEALSCFQAAIQSVCENVVLLDRVQFLMEKGVKCYVEKVTNECLSPRCYALVATKS